VDEQARALEAHYTSVCANLDSLDDRLIIDYPIDYHHFTLFYYDRAANLVKTVPPNWWMAGAKQERTDSAGECCRFSSSSIILRSGFLALNARHCRTVASVQEKRETNEQGKCHAAS